MSQEASGLFTGWSALRAYPTFRVLGDFFLLESNHSDTFFSLHDGGLYVYYRAVLLWQGLWGCFTA